MKRLTDLQYLQLHFWDKLAYNLKCFFCAIPQWFLNLFKKIGRSVKKLGIGIKDEFVDIGRTFAKGSWQTKVSYFVMGFGSMARKQIGRGILFFLFEVLFILYMVFFGGHWLGKFGTLGTQLPGEYIDPVLGVPVRVDGDDSFKILLYGILTIAVIIGFIYTWRLNVKQNRILDEIVAEGRRIKTARDDFKAMVDEEYHKTLLALPVTGIALFTVLPIIFMILVAFTGYDGTHDGFTNLFTWVGLDNFNRLFSSTGGFAVTFGEILGWTLLWSLFATFTNYFLGMFVAIMINKKGIRLKKVWRTILILTIAIPQFISLLYVSKMFESNGLINSTLMSWGWIKEPIPFWTDKNWARATVIIVNIWIGIPYLMLMTTGILMNIPADLYESAKIDGANIWQQYTRITLPYILFITGPYLLTSFIGNINNFNVIFLLTGGGPNNTAVNGVSVGHTDLLITWLFNLTIGGATADYKLAAVVGIMIFIVIAVLSLIVYNIMPSNKNEEDYQ